MKRDYCAWCGKFKPDVNGRFCSDKCDSADAAVRGSIYSITLEDICDADAVISQSGDKKKLSYSDWLRRIMDRRTGG